MPTLLGSKGPLQFVAYFIHYYIIVLLIDTCSLIYMLCIKRGRARASVSTVGDDELTARGYELTLSEVAEGGTCVGGCRG